MNGRLRIATFVLSAFIGVVLVQDAYRDDVSPLEHWVSHLSLGDSGWVNITAPILTGLVTLTIVPAVRAAGRWPARWVAVVGVGLLIVGGFVSDAPPGTAYPEEMTWHGQVHDIGGGLVFVGLIATCITTSRYVSRRGGLICALVVTVGWVTASVLAAIGYADDSLTLPSGLAERVALFTGIAWLAVLARHLDRATPTEGTAS